MNVPWFNPMLLSGPFHHCQCTCSGRRRIYCSRIMRSLASCPDWVSKVRLFDDSTAHELTTSLQTPRSDTMINQLVSSSYQFRSLLHSLHHASASILHYLLCSCLAYTEPLLWLLLLTVHPQILFSVNTGALTRSVVSRNSFCQGLNIIPQPLCSCFADICTENNRPWSHPCLFIAFLDCRRWEYLYLYRVLLLSRPP